MTPWHISSTAACSADAARWSARAKGRTWIYAGFFNWAEIFCPTSSWKVADVKGSKTFITRALSTLKRNLERTGDPLGFKQVYWTEWAEGLGLPKEGKSLLFTGRMYQMLPYVIQTTALMTEAKPLLSTKGLDWVMDLGNRVAGERVLRWKAKGEREIRERGKRVLRGIVAGLESVGQHPAYLYASEPYSGILLYDLGLEKAAASHIHRVVDLLKRRGIEEVITVDPHTTFMLKEIYPTYVPDFDIRVRHYLEILSQPDVRLSMMKESGLPQEFVMHDSCVMTRDLGIVEEARNMAERLDVQLLEPESRGPDTACCGGPVEYAFADLSHEISALRMEELAPVNSNILVTCPICLINLTRHEERLGARVWDLGEVLYRVMAAGKCCC
jgi:Fe-S oxidoreductase